MVKYPQRKKKVFTRRCRRCDEFYKTVGRRSVVCEDCYSPLQGHVKHLVNIGFAREEVKKMTRKEALSIINDSETLRKVTKKTSSIRRRRKTSVKCSRCPTYIDSSQRGKAAICEHCTKPRFTRTKMYAKELGLPLEEARAYSERELLSMKWGHREQMDGC